MLIGRQKEQDTLRKAFHSERSEFVVVYGRRRIGKTFLIRETFGNNFTFQYTGIFNVSSKIQLQQFYHNLLEQGLSSTEKAPKNWFEAFNLLKILISSSSEERKVVFIDELPWMDSSNSHFVSALENFWNGWAAARKDILLIICGSATSWIINKIFRNKGGLYNRVTYKIRLNQFSLYECEQLIQAYRFPYNRNAILEGYMVMGGVPFYWTKLDRTKSIGRNINDLFLHPDGELHDEFPYIYSSMFNRPDKYIKVIEALAGKKSGLTRDEILTKAKLGSNGRISEILEDLIECGFIRKYCHTGKRIKDALYQLIDCFSLFYYQFVKKARNVDDDYWVKSSTTSAYHTWCGLSFERVCLLHTRQIKEAMGISGITVNIFSWHIKPTSNHPGVQIDLLFDRSDNVIDVFEIKYAPEGYTVTTSVLKNIQTKLNVLRENISPRKYIEAVLITSNGVKPNYNSMEIPQILESSQLFKP